MMIGKWTVFLCCINQGLGPPMGMSSPNRTRRKKMALVYAVLAAICCSSCAAGSRSAQLSQMRKYTARRLQLVHA